MTDDAIYFKTAAGDEAVRERTRLVKRNLRMVLILVDGFADVAELKRKVGDAAVVESALAELERVGLVESVDARMARQGAAVQAAEAVADAVPADTAEVADAAVPAPPMAELPVLTEVVVAPPVPEAPLTDAVTVFDEETAAKVCMIPAFPATTGGEAPPGPPPGRSPLEKVSGWWQALRASHAQAREEALYEKAYGQSDEEAVTIKPIQRGPRPSRSLLARGLGGLVGLALLAVLGILLFPYDRYRPDFEHRLSRLVDAPVTIGAVEVTFSPYPAVALERVTVGEGEATAAAIRLLPDPLSLFGAHRYRQVRIEGLRLSDAGLARAPRWFAAGALGDVVIDGIEIAGLGVQLGRQSVEGLSGTAEIDAHGGLVKVVLGQPDGGLRVELAPRPDGYAVAVSATSWTGPFRPPLVFDRLEARGELTGGRLALSRIEGLLYDGVVGGDGVVSWQPTASLVLGLHFERLAADKLLALFGAEPGLEGMASGRLRVEASAPSLAGLDRTLRMDGSFEVAQGSLKRIDLAGAMRAAGQPEPVRGGATRFEEFSGALAVDDKAVRLSRLRLSSGLMQAFGQVAVSRQTMGISGGGNAEMRGTARALHTTISVSGKAADPELKAGL